MPRKRHPQTECRITLEHRIIADSATTSLVDQEGPITDCDTAPLVDEEERKRLTIDLTGSLQHRFKTECIINQTTMAEEVRKFIEWRTNELERERKRKLPS